jgi:hypothetical protein
LYFRKVYHALFLFGQDPKEYTQSSRSTRETYKTEIKQTKQKRLTERKALVKPEEAAPSKKVDGY